MYSTQQNLANRFFECENIKRSLCFYKNKEIFQKSIPYKYFDITYIHIFMIAERERERERERE